MRHRVRPPNENLIAEARTRFGGSLSLAPGVKDLVLSLADALEEAISCQKGGKATSDRDRLLKDLDASQEITLSVLADTYEDAGDAAMAKAIRLLVGHRKWPGHIDHLYRWSEDKGYGANSFSLDPCILKHLEGDLVVRVAGAAAARRQGIAARFLSPSSAILAAAKAIVLSMAEIEREKKASSVREHLAPAFEQIDL